MNNPVIDQTERPLTVAQTVAAYIRERILRREIGGGDPLRQDVIAKSFGISTIPVREALRQLEVEGLVEVKTRRGAVATELTVDKALEWIHLRKLIEIDLLDLALGRAVPGHLERAERVLGRFSPRAHTALTLDQWSQFDWEFHAALYAAANRPEAMKVLESLHRRCDRYVRLKMPGADDIERAQKEHRELIELCRKDRRSEAKALLSSHLDGILENHVVHMNKPIHPGR